MTHIGSQRHYLLFIIIITLFKWGGFYNVDGKGNDLALGRTNFER